MALTILGLSGALSHDPSAALYIDGKLIAESDNMEIVSAVCRQYASEQGYAPSAAAYAAAA